MPSFIHRKRDMPALFLLVVVITLHHRLISPGYCGANLNSQKRVRFVHELAWQQHFVSNMFIRPQTREELDGFEPDFTIINACSQVNEEWEKHNLNSEVAIAFNIEQRVAVILGTWSVMPS